MRRGQSGVGACRYRLEHIHCAESWRHDADDERSIRHDQCRIWRIRPDAGNTTPAGLAIFSYRSGGFWSARPAFRPPPSLRTGRIYAEVNSPLNTGLAIANPNDQTATINSFSQTVRARSRFRKHDHSAESATRQIPGPGTVQDFQRLDFSGHTQFYSRMFRSESLRFEVLLTHV